VRCCVSPIGVAICVPLRMSQRSGFVSLFIAFPGFRVLLPLILRV
jgi:hypothetical protein